MVLAKKTLKSLIASLTLATAITFGAANSAIAKDTEVERLPKKNEPKKARLVEVGGLYSFGYGDIENQNADEPYNVNSVMLRLGWDIKPVAKKIPLIQKIPMKGSLTGLVEPFGSYTSSPDTNFETGVNLLAKYNFRDEKRDIDTWWDRFNPYVEAGFGGIYASQSFAKQSTKGNFIIQAGAGLDYRLHNKINLILGYRRRHFSNAKIEKPNRGVDINQAVFGISCRF